MCSNKLYPQDYSHYSPLMTFMDWNLDFNLNMNYIKSNSQFYSNLFNSSYLCLVI